MTLSILSSLPGLLSSSSVLEKGTVTGLCIARIWEKLSQSCYKFCSIIDIFGTIDFSDKISYNTVRY